MKTKKINFHRLIKLAAFLETKINTPVAPAKISYFYNEEENEFQVHHEGFEWIINFLPICFPNDWFYYEEKVKLKDKPSLHIVDSFLEYFNIEEEQYCYLFLPDMQIPEALLKFGGRKLSENATPTDVSYNIRKFVARFTKVN